MEKCKTIRINIIALQLLGEELNALETLSHLNSIIIWEGRYYINFLRKRGNGDPRKWTNLAKPKKEK